ncbi:MAG: LamG domain-containing protein [Planctomycetes bacterium]|nr:LamG domain-containing protein [Planctomycetota bacterium]
MRILAFLSSVTLCASLASAAEDGLVAYYDFDEGAGATLRDRSGNGNHGRIHGARYVKRGDGFCLRFDGEDDYVNCGNRPSLDLHEAVTLEAWVYPEGPVAGEPGIVGKHFSSFLLTYYTNGKAYWYITEGSNSCRAVLAPGAWHHLAGTFDGSTLCLYIDGKLVDSRPSKHAKIAGTGNFLIGCVVGDPSAKDPAYTRTSHFPGKIDEVRVYRRALTPREIAEHYKTGLEQFGMAYFEPVVAGTTVGSSKLSITVDAGGRIQINTADGRYVAESAYSYPGRRIGWNVFGADQAGSEKDWSPRTRKVSDRTVEVKAAGAHCAVRRRVTVDEDRIKVEDRLSIHSGQPVGVLITNTITAPRAFDRMLSPNRPESPLIYAAGATETLGVLVEDDIARRKFEAQVGLPLNQIKFGVNNLALDNGRSYTMRWTLYVLPARADYFDLVNQVRRDWNSINMILGPLDWFDIGRRARLLKDPQALKAYFQRKKQGLVLITPWLDYDPGSFDRVWPRDEYKRRVREAARLIRQANPGVKVLGCIETDWVTIDPARIPNGQKLPIHKGGRSTQRKLTPEQTRILDRSGIPFLDSVRRDADGNLMLELYRRGGKPQTALAVYPAVGNYQYQFLLGQVKFLIDEVGLDGFYIDEFNQAFRHDLRDYSGWDGYSAEIDRRTGQIKRRYIDCSIAGIEARLKLCEYALSRGRVVVANTYATTRAEQSLPTNRFSETQSAFNPFAVPDGTEPPLVLDLLKGHLASPIGLGIVPQPGNRDIAKTVMKAVITYLRHGMVYYHYAIGDIPETGVGSGEYGPINHMFPITPLELHKGWILGKERIITCVSGEYDWDSPRRPVVHLFDLRGRPVDHDFRIVQVRHGWQVRIELQDWAQIAVIE